MAEFGGFWGALRTPHFPKEPEVLGTPSKFFGALRAQRMTPPTLASGGRARRTFQFSDLVGPHFFAPNQATHTQAPSENFMDFLSDKPGDRFNPRQSILPGARAPREPLAPGRQGTSGPWSSGGSPPLVISRICRGIPGLRSRFRASSRGFPRKFLDGMAQN